MGIMLSWEEVGRAIHSLWSKHPKLKGRGLHTIGTIDLGMLQGILDEKTLALARRLQRIRDEAAHARGPNAPTPAESVEFRAMAQAVAEHIRAITNQITNLGES